MTTFGYDPEAVYQDADIEQAAFEAEGARLAALRRQGICSHGWRLGGNPAPEFDASRAEIERDRQRGDFPDRPTDPAVTHQRAIPAGQDLCLDCGQLVPSWDLR